MRNLKFYFFLIAVLFSVLVNAQIKKGSVFLGGDISAATQKTETGPTTSKQSVVTISPVFGKAIKDNMVLGADLLYGHYDYESTSEQKVDIYGAGIFLRKYKPIGSSGFYIFLQGRAGYRLQKNEVDANTPAVSVAKSHSVSLSIYPGLSYAVSKRLHLETGFNNLVSIAYSKDTQTSGNPVVSKSQSSGFSISSSLNNVSNLYLGFRVLLSK